MQNEAYTGYMLQSTVPIICTQAMKLTPMRNVKVHKKVVIVYHCKPFDLSVCANNYPYTTTIIPTEVLEILRKDETSYDIHTNAFSPFPSKSAALMFLLDNSTRPIVRVLLLQAVASATQ